MTPYGAFCKSIPWDSDENGSRMRSRVGFCVKRIGWEGSVSRTVLIDSYGELENV